MKGTFFLNLYGKQLSLSSFREQPVSAPLFADHGSESAPPGSSSHRSDQRRCLHLQTLHVTCLGGKNKCYCNKKKKA